MSDAREKLIRQLQGAYSGELAAGYAYRGHWHSVRDAAERECIRTIEAEEWHHRDLVGAMLRDLGARPNRRREAIFYCIGKVIAGICHVGGWFIPMYGAGRLERHNIIEYEDAAVYARECGHEEMIDCLVTMAQVEWEHEKFFRERITGHWMLRWLPLWEPPLTRPSATLSPLARGEGADITASRPEPGSRARASGDRCTRS